jgi:hypothetical protein
LPRGLDSLQSETLDGKFAVPFKLLTKKQTEMGIIFNQQLAKEAVKDVAD